MSPAAPRQRRAALVPRRLASLVRLALVEKVPRDHLQPDAAFRRRRVVAAVVLLAGTVLLGVSLSVRPGDQAFYPLTFALAAVWVIGGFASGPLHLGRIAVGGRLRRPVVTPVGVGLAFVAVFTLGALVVREIGPLADYTENVLAHARSGSLPLLVVITALNGISEEVFFRGALYAAIGVRHPVLISTLVYAVATVATGNPMLVFAALTLGAVLGLQRRASGGLLAPILTHVTWSVGMLLILPPLFAGR
ncbi:MAG TPA: type II CAAX endopeptidase family protein [Jatrophihabitans sp.]|nr:type II CAAX endopeptidase family protein [Jatrophihabitans sp.]